MFTVYSTTGKLLGRSDSLQSAIHNLLAWRQAAFIRHHGKTLTTKASSLL